MTRMTNSPLPVSQADRDAAAPFARGALQGSTRAGLCDSEPHVQAFAAYRHRLTADQQQVTTEREAGLREALERIAAFKPKPEYGDWADKVDGQGYNRAGQYAADIARAALTGSAA